MKEVTRRYRAIADNPVKHLLVVLIWSARAALAAFNGVYPIPGAGRIGTLLNKGFISLTAACYESKQA